MLELRHYQLVVAAAEEGTLVAAGRRLHLTPSALSHRLAPRRGGAGGNAVPAATPPAAPHRRWGAIPRFGAEGAGRGRSGRGFGATRGRRAADPPQHRLLHGVRLAGPGVDALLRHPSGRRGAGSDRGDAASAGGVAGGQARNLGLTSTEPSHPRLVDVPLFRDELVLVVPTDHRLAGQTSVRPEDLASERLLTYDAPREELDVFSKFLWPGGVEPARTQRVPLTEAMVELVAAGCRGDGAGHLGAEAGRPQGADPQALDDAACSASGGRCISGRARASDRSSDSSRWCGASCPPR